MVSKDTYWNQCASKRGRKKLKILNLGIPEVLTVCQDFPHTENGTEGKSEKCQDSWCHKITNTIKAIQVSIYLTGNVWLDSIWLYITQSHLTCFSLGLKVGIKIRWEWGPIKCFYQIFCSSNIYSTIGLGVHMSIFVMCWFSRSKCECLMLWTPPRLEKNHSTSPAWGTILNNLMAMALRGWDVTFTKRDFHQSLPSLFPPWNSVCAWK